MRHIIRTQVLDVLTDNSTDAFEMQHAMSSVYYRTILPALEKAFDEWAPEGKLITLDSIQIDFGHIDLDHFSKSECIHLIKDQLFQQLNTQAGPDSKKGEPTELFKSVLERWLYYMEHGYLPWNTLSVPDNWMEEVMGQLETSASAVERTRSLILRRKEAATRIAKYIAAPFLSHFITLLTNGRILGFSELLESMSRILEDANSHLNASGPGNNLLQWWKEAILLAVRDNSIHTGQELFMEAVIPVLHKQQITTLSTISEAKLPPKMQPYLDNMKKRIKATVRQQKGEMPVKKEEDVSSSKDRVPEEGLFVSNAGVVLLHPFLGSFFTLNEWLTNGRFISKEAQQQAIMVLHFLVTGATELEEHDAVVYKILCGFPVEEPLEAFYDVTELQMKESIGLLESVIENWPILKNTSVDTLRDCFLQRNGKLINTPGGDIRLLIENDALDILLEHLPWGISMIKQPWMRQILKVEWH